MLSLHRYKNLVSLYHAEHRGYLRFEPTLNEKEEKPMLPFDANRFKIHVPSVKRLYERDTKEGKSLDDIIQVITLSTSMPVMAAVLWIQCLYGTNEEIEKKIISFQKYYGYESIIPVVYTSEEK